MANQRLRESWTLNEERLTKLLEALDADERVAAERYEHLRRGLIRFFDWRGSTWAESDADETIDRVARKLIDTPIENVHNFAHAVARNVARESLRRQQREQVGLESVYDISIHRVQDAEAEKRFDCFERCLKELPVGKEKLILSYYQGDKQTRIRNRQQMAERVGIPLNRLRIQAHRIREALEACINTCLSKASGRH